MYNDYGGDVVDDDGDNHYDDDIQNFLIEANVELVIKTLVKYTKLDNIFIELID